MSTHIRCIDSHAHFWDLEKFALPWHAQFPSLSKTFSIEDYLYAFSFVEELQTVYVEVNVRNDQVSQEAMLIENICRDPTTVYMSGVPAVDLTMNELHPVLAHYQMSPHIFSTRMVFWPENIPERVSTIPNVVKNIKLHNEYDLCYEICIRFEQIPYLVELLDQVQQTTIIINHCAAAKLDRTNTPLFKAWLQAIETLGKMPNIYCKLSGLMESVTRPLDFDSEMRQVVDHLILHFGADRLLYGSNWPVCTLSAHPKMWFDWLMTHISTHHPTALKNIFFQTAQRLYRI